MKTDIKNIKRQIAGIFMLLAWAGQAFAGATVGSVSVGTQTPNPVQPGNEATYTVTVTRAGLGNLDVYLTITNLPAGVTASFVPSMVHFAGSNSIGSSILTLATSSSLASGSYAFLVTGRDGGSFNVAISDGVLVVGAGNNRTVVSRASLSLKKLPAGSVQINCTGTPGYLYRIQATTELSNPLSWMTIGSGLTDSNGLYSLIDPDTGSYTCRFYRAVTTN